VHGGKEKGSARTNFTQQPIKCLALDKNTTMVSASEEGDVKRSYASHTEISMLAKLHAQAFMAAHYARGAARVVTTMLSSLQGCMTDACNASDATLWSTAAAASAELVRAAHRCELLGGSVDVQEALASHIAVAVKQLEQLDRMLSAASACNQMFVALADVDVRVLEPHLQGVWHALWASHRHDVAGAGRAACDVISAYGDIRQVPALLRAFTEALTSAQAAQQGGQIAAMSCAAAISAAWCAAATKVPAAQTPSVLVVVQECLNVAQEAGVLGGRQALSPCLADTLA
jgi:hypothetical protein